MRKQRLLLVLLLTLALSIPASVFAQDATSTTSPQPEQTFTPSLHDGYIRVAHFSWSAPQVDIYIDDVQTFTGLGFPDVTDWIPIHPGRYDFTITPTGQGTQNALVSHFPLMVYPDTWQTVATVGSINRATFTPTIIGEDYGSLPPGTAGLTFFNGVEDSPKVNVQRNHVTYLSGLGFPASGSHAFDSIHVDSGTFDIAATEQGHPKHILAENKTLKLPEDAYTLVALVGPISKPQLVRIVTDRAQVMLVQGTLPQPGTLMAALRSTHHLIGFADALQQAGLATTLNSGDYTILAPANFTLKQGSMSSSQLAKMLKGYIVKGTLASKAIENAGTLTTLAGTKIDITTHKNAIFADSAQFIKLNIPATNGMIHEINQPLPAS